MEPADRRPEPEPAQTDDEQSAERETGDSETETGRIPVSRRGTLTSLAGVGGLGLMIGTARAGHQGPHWRNDVDADGNALFDLGGLSTRADGTRITEFAGDNLTISGNVLDATDTRTDVSDARGTVVEDAENIVAGDGLSVTPTGGGTGASLTVDTTTLEGVDADTVDGQHASEFAPATHDHSGDTLNPDTVTAGAVDATRSATDEVGVTMWRSGIQSVPPRSETRVAFNIANKDQRSEADTTNHIVTPTESGNYLASVGLTTAEPIESEQFLTVKLVRDPPGGARLTDAVTERIGEGNRESVSFTRPLLGIGTAPIEVTVWHTNSSSLSIMGSRSGTYLSVVQL